MIKAEATSRTWRAEMGPEKGIVYDWFVAAAKIAKVVFDVMPWSRPIP